MFKKRSQVYACLRRARRTFGLGRNLLPYGDEQVRNIRLRGRFVAYSWRRSPTARVRVKELRRGRTVHDARAAVVVRPGFAELTALVLKRNGSIAWIVRTNPFDVTLKPYPLPIDYLPFWEVSKFDRGGRALLDTGRDIASSLLLRGATIYWAKAGRVRAAALN